MDLVQSLLLILLTIYWLVLLGRIILDLLISLNGGRGLSGLAIVYGILYDLTEPVLRPIRRLLPPLRVGAVALDLSPLIVFVLIALLRQVVNSS
jgi:YggT family protein